MINIFWGIVLVFISLMGFILLILFGWVVSGYNNLVNSKVSINTQWSNVKTEYQRRSDLFYNLVQTVKSHKKFESSTLKEVIQARSSAFFGGSKLADMKKMSQLDGVFSKLLAVFEQYPKLVSSEQHNKLMDEIRVTEDRVNVARTDYNDIVRTYNIYVRSFPSNIIAKMFAYKPETFFVNEESTNEAPKINLE